MSGRISQPVGQVRFTNVAVVRMKKAGKRFEVAAYKNKVMNWRSRVETDINEVLQSDSVYTNVSKGVVANRKDLMEAFGTDDMLKVAMLILDKGDVEVSDKERAALTESLFHDIASIICQKCVNPATKLPYTLSMIERALRDIHFSVVLGKTAKQQALKAVALLKEHMDIERASMRVRVGVPTSGTFGSSRARARVSVCVCVTRNRRSLTTGLWQVLLVSTGRRVMSVATASRRKPQRRPGRRVSFCVHHMPPTRP